MSSELIGRGHRRALIGIGSAAAQTFAAQIALQLAGFATAVLVARQVGPEQFGLYSFAVVVATLVAAVPGAALDMSAVRVSGRSFHEQRARARGVLLMSGVFKLSSGILLVLGAVFVVAPLMGSVAGRPELADPLRLGVLAALALAIREFALAVLQAFQRFGSMLLVNVATAVIRVGLVLAILWSAALSAALALNAFVVAAWIGCLVGIILGFRTLRGPIQLSRSAARELFTYSRWMVLATIFGALANNLDVLVVSRWADAESAGLYLSARTLALPIGLLGAALSTVLLPKFSRLSTPGDLSAVLRQIGPALLVATIAGMVVLILAAQLIMPMLLGERFAPAVPIFRLQVLVYGGQLLTWPAITLLMVLDRPIDIARLNLMLLVLAAIAFAALTPVWGVSGVAVAYLLSIVVVLVASYFIAWLAVIRPTAMLHPVEAA